MGDYRTTAGESHPIPRKERRSKRRRNILIVLLLVAMAAVAASTINVDRSVPASGYVTSRDYAQVRPATGGTVTRIVASTGDLTAEGDLLVQLDDVKQRAAQRAAGNELRKAQAALTLRRAELAEKKRRQASEITRTRMELDHAKKRLALTRELNSRGLSSGRTVTEDVFAVEKAKALLMELEAADPKLACMQIEVLQKAISVREDAVARAKALVEERKIRAPIAGKLNRFTFYVGEVVRPENILFEVYGGETDRLKLKVPERFATRIARGRRCQAELRSYTQTLSHHWFEGSVIELRDVIQSENQSSYRIIYCEFDNQGLEIPPGTSADAYIYTGESSLWKALLGL